MEFPHLGQHCNESTCKQLDFLPMKCDACSKIFCRDHIMYTSHKCPDSYKKDNQIPVCPLCNLPIPLRKGELPDVVVGRHIESDCQSDPAKERRKVYTNRCSKKGCKQKELVPVKCETCRLNFCLRHRHELDHNCKGYQNSGRAVSNAGAAALLRAQQATSSKKSQNLSSSSSSSSGHPSNRNSNSVPRANNPAALSSLQGTLTEDEALARALQQSLGGSSDALPEGMSQQEREDFLLAQALSASEQEAARSRQRPAQTAGNRQDQRSACTVQ
ncbi:AN1-type zinc finger protein 2A isoform X2 [Aplysia californica]|uniref:AN1-type zinc finger protein 2A isoform X2 n=1 Tax=Aplysia californica TaxID=6500 RepID=A0ABM1W171_APLCA|nr:AN1-type zinc finger protein 2A isoform X2 [Aplysia californica]